MNGATGDLRALHVLAEVVRVRNTPQSVEDFARGLCIAPTCALLALAHLLHEGYVTASTGNGAVTSRMLSDFSASKSNLFPRWGVTQKGQTFIDYHVAFLRPLLTD